MELTYASSVAVPRGGALAVPINRDEYRSLCSDLGDLQRVASALTGLFTEMKREQTLQTRLMQQQIELMESLANACSIPKTPIMLLTNLPILPAGQISADSREALQIPSPPNSHDQEALSKAHDWFQSRLLAIGSPVH